LITKVINFLLQGQQRAKAGLDDQQGSRGLARLGAGP